MLLRNSLKKRSGWELRSQLGRPVLLNTSFNGKDEPIVCSVEDAWRCFMATDIDLLVLERFLVEKNCYI